MPALPRAMLIDMDDTILSAYSRPELAWRAVTEEFAGELGPFTSEEVTGAIVSAGQRFWQTAEAHWRLKLREARRIVVADGFSALAAAGKVTPTDDFLARLAHRFDEYREENMRLFPDAHASLDAFRERGIRLALVTNGAGETQRAKIERFALADRFDHVQIEGEHGFGKPDEQSYLHAMEKLGVGPRDTWMIGDNLEWEVVAPQRLGIYAIWMDVHGDGLPDGSPVKPDRIIRSLSELLAD